LLKLGGLPPTYYYIQASKVFTIYYFLYFLVIIPNLHKFEDYTYFKKSDSINLLDKNPNETAVENRNKEDLARKCEVKECLDKKEEKEEKENKGIYVFVIFTDEFVECIK